MQNREGFLKVMRIAHFFSDVPEDLADEIVEAIIDTKACRIERIVSRGHASPKDFWYDQERNEWVIVLKGRAVLEFEGAQAPVELGAGDHVNIAAHQKHRVEWTDPKQTTVWLAVYYQE